MSAALESYGTAIGVLADSLLRSSVSGKFRDAIVDQRLLLISPYNPEAGFNVGNAMGRNKYIYSLSCNALIISAEKEKGGTWAGATEELKRKNGVKVFVRNEGNVPGGNREMLKLGALPFPERPWNKSLFETLANVKVPAKMIVEQTSMFDDIDENSKENGESTSDHS
jgi:predicted Rossmann fold nucleotide-binding protein DprA/Smf involved in DNA uptake